MVYDFYETTLLFLLYLTSVIDLSLAVSEKHCDAAYECVDQTLNNDGDEIHLNGYKSAYGRNTSASSSFVYCQGSFSCDSMSSIMSQQLYCRARDSCSNAIIQSTTGTYCHGTNSCAFSNITASNDHDLNCKGYLSCRDANIRCDDGTTTIDAHTSLSLYNATIETIGATNSEITLDLYGSLSGFAAKLICRAGHICNINCNSYDACYMFYIECIGTCNVDAVNVIQPITNLTQFNNFLITSIPKRFKSQAQIPINDELCANDTLNFDDSRQHMDGADIIIDIGSEGPICCRGLASCNDVNSLQYKSTINNDVICDGYDSCGLSVINSNYGNVYCEGQQGCKDTLITHSTAVYCAGAWSCRYSTIISANYVLCNGHVGCKNSTIISNGSDANIYFVAREAGSDATVYCNATDKCNVYCSGYRACLNTKLFCANNCNVTCDEEEAWCPVITNDLTMNPTKQTMYPSTSRPSSTPYESLFTTERTTDSSSKSTKTTPYSSWNASEATTSSASSLSTEIISSTHSPSAKNESIIAVIIISVTLFVWIILIGICYKVLYKNKAKSEDDQVQIQEMQNVIFAQNKKVGAEGDTAVVPNQKPRDLLSSLVTTSAVQKGEGFIVNQEQNQMNIEYNMNAEDDEIVVGDDEITSGKQTQQINDDDELLSGPPTVEGMNVDKCVDCGEVKEGTIFLCVDCGEVKEGTISAADGLFHCNQCSDNDINMHVQETTY